MTALLRATQNLLKTHHVRFFVWTRVLLNTPHFGSKGSNRLHMSVLLSGLPFAILILESFVDSSQMNWLVTEKETRKDQMSVLFSGSFQ
jgi:hypothetical protein